MCSKNSQHESEVICTTGNEIPIKIEKSIQRIIKNEGFFKYEVDKRCVSTQNGNYLGVLYEIDVKGSTKDGDKELNIFVKHIRPQEDTPKIICISDVYKTEIFAYKELFKVFEELQIKANVPPEKRYKKVKSYNESNDEAIIMENIAKKGFNTYYRMEVASLNFLEMSVEELAKFHALSFVLKENRPEYFNKKIRPLKFPFNFGEDWPSFVQNIKRVATDFVDDKYKERVENFYNVIVKKYPQYYNDESSKICLCHGDYRPNNILTKMVNGKEEEIIAVDYQLIHYGSPALDFLYFIFSCTDRETRRAQLSNLKDLYYESFNKFLKYFNLDANVVYPREEFEKVYREKFDVGLMISLLYLPFIFASEDCVPDLNVMSFQLDSRYKCRLRAVIEDYVELGLI